MSELKTSGSQREFNTGSHRDASVGKGRMDLLPASSVLKVLDEVTDLEKNMRSDMYINYSDYAYEAFKHAMHYMNGEHDRDYLTLAARAAVIATGQYESLNEPDDDKAKDCTNPLQCLAFGLKQVSKHYEAGAQKYGENNWQLGQPMSVLLDSGMRHNVKAISEITDEPHCRAAAWNYLCAIWTEMNKPELQNIPTRMSNAANAKKEEE